MNNTVASTIRSQLGVALAMLGANSLVALPNGLQFGIKGCKTVNKIVITLEPTDVYTVAFWRINARKFDMVQVAEVGEVYADSLHSTIAAHTGLATRL